MAPRADAAALVVLAAVLLALSSSAGAETIEGQVVAAVDGIRLADVGPIVVYLDGVDGRLRYRVPPETPHVRQRDARFVPSFLVVVAGQSVRMPNEDAIYHNVFSYSRPNDFDLGLYPGGESRSVELRHPGVVKTYCSIHESMNGVIFVAPSPHYAIASASGRFSIDSIPPGRYRLSVWSEQLPPVEREVRVEPGGRIEVDLVLAAASASGAAAAVSRAASSASPAPPQRPPAARD